MTDRQALTQARKRWGTRAYIEREKSGAFIGDDGKWRDALARVCEHGRTNHVGDNGERRDRSDAKYCNSHRDFYIVARTLCEHCGNGTKYTLGKVKYPVASYKVGETDCVGGIGFFHVRGSGESWEAAFRAADPTVKEETEATS